MNLAKVSVIIPNYNYGKYVTRTIDSVLAQTYKNVEIIVVDDGSKDESLEVLAGYGDKITLIRQTNQGVSLARNNGVKNSRGDYVAFLDADDIWLPEKLERQMRKYESEPGFGLVHCSMTFIDPDDKPCGESREGLEGWVSEEFLYFERGVVIGAGSTSLVPRTVFDEVGGFDRRLSTSADWDFSYRISTRYPIGFVDENLVLYRVHNSNMHSNIKLMEHDMLLGYEKAFSEATNADRRYCYGNLHRTLAGSYFQAGQYRNFAIHTWKSLINRPASIFYFLDFPRRRLRRG